MTNHYLNKREEADARERLRAFWAGSSLGRPALNVLVEKPGFAEAVWPRPELGLKDRVVGYSSAQPRFHNRMTLCPS